MPNHIHGIIVIDNSVFKSGDVTGNGFKPFPTKQHGLSEMVRALKSFSSRRINEKMSISHISQGDNDRNGLKPFPTNTPPNDYIGNGFKPFPTEIPLRFKWQKSFHDHIIRDFKALENIRNYINTNPANWEKDTFFSE